jgi:cysteinyl-tRNA synthetase
LAEGKKISKSLNNGYSLTDLQEKGYSAMDFKMFVLQSQYRTESNFTWENLAAAHARLKHWHEVAVLRHQSDDQTETHGTDKPIDTAAIISAITDALSTDLNSPQALTLIEKGFAQFEHGAVGHSAATSLETFLQFIDNALGLGIIAATSDINPAQKEMLRTREKARADKDWGRSDELRDALASEGIGVSDNPAGTRWYYL